MSKSNVPSSGKDARFKLNHQALEQRRRFILLFLLINVLIFILIWLMRQNQELIRENEGLRIALVGAETRIVGAVTTCEIDCTDKMVTVAAKLGTEVARLTATIGASTPLPTPGYPTGTSPPSTPTASPPPTPTSTPTMVPTDTPTPSPSPVIPDTPTAAPRPSDTPTSPPPPAPAVYDIRPLSMTRIPGSSERLTVVITGDNFIPAPMPVVRLRDIPAMVLEATTEVITVTVPYTMAAGIYGLTVANYDGRFGILSPAFTVYEPEPSDPDRYSTLESSYLVTFGRDANRSLGDDDQVQLLFIEVSASLTDALHLRIFDADTGGLNVGDMIVGTADTTISYTLYGLTNTYTLSEAQAAHPLTVGITSGTLLTSATFGPGDSDTWDNKWYLFHSFLSDKGEQVGSRCVFKLAVEGAQGDDGNWYNVVVSGLPATNTALSGVRLFAYSWTWLVYDWLGGPYEKYRPHLYLYVPTDTTSIQPHFFPDNLPFQNGKECVQICPLLSKCQSAEAAEYLVGSNERGATWTIDMSNCELRDPSRSYTIGFWAEDQGGVALPIFSRPAIVAPP